MDNKTLITEFVAATVISDTVVDGKRHYVTPDGDRYPSVTTVLSAMSDQSYLVEWRNRIGHDAAEEITRKAAARGTSMHSICEAFFRGDPIDKTADGYKLFRQLKIYLDHLTPIGMEVPLWSNVHKVAGRTDVVGTYKGALSIVDYKSSRKEKLAEDIKNYFLQSTIYSLMLEERLGIVTEKIAVLIGVDSGFPQEFVRKVSDYKQEAIDILKRYHERKEEVMI